MAINAAKISVIGAGSVGSTVAYTLMLKEFAGEIVLVNRNADRSRARASDIAHCTALTGRSQVKSGTFSDMEGSQIVVITAGTLPDMHGTRTDVLSANVDIYKSIIPEIERYCPESILVVVSNPVDIMAYAAYSLSGFNASRIIGSGTLLDTLRLKYMIGNEFSINPADIQTFVVGEHGETQVPLWSHTSVNGIKIDRYLSDRGIILDSEMKSRLSEAARRAGWDIRHGNEHSCYCISMCVVKILESIIKDRRTVLPVSTLVDGAYGIKGSFISLPSVLGPSGVREVLELPISRQESDLLQLSAESVREYMKYAERR
jgi:L-lactate dehydrogenase